ncbi:acyl-CoA dehydrogenase family protein [Chloroflexota bacterium]
MHFRFFEAEDQFRQEIREFLDRNLPKDWIKGGYYAASHAQDDEEWNFCRDMSRKLGERGWLSLAWPKEYGGQGRSHVEQAIFNEEMAYRKAPGVEPVTVNFLAPTLIEFGSEEQKTKHLPLIASGETSWCEGFSEPEAGSDLASLQLRATEDGDFYVLNGQKIWISNAHRADWCFCLARTDPEVKSKHKGISFFLVDMKTQGIMVKPLLQLFGAHGFNQVFFDNVRVPKENMVGEKNRGWYVAMGTLSLERSGILYSASSRSTLEDVLNYIKETMRSGRGIDDNFIVRSKLAEIAIEIEVARWLAYRVAWMQDQGLPVEHEASVSMLFGGELIQRTARVTIEVLGLFGQLEPGSKWAQIKGAIEQGYLITLSTTIAGGTSEIQRNIIAQRGLGLPR